jgi:fructose-bisphosphate aldolase class II
MKIASSILGSILLGTITASAFVTPTSNSPVAFHRSNVDYTQSGSTLKGAMSDELNIPCDDECAMTSYKNLPASVHPGVVTGQAMMDLLNHARENGYAIPAVNCVSSSGINACLEAARKNDAPIIIQFSSGGSQVRFYVLICDESFCLYKSLTCQSLILLF